jgi:hypothetical protein
MVIVLIQDLVPVHSTTIVEEIDTEMDDDNSLN